MGKGHLCTGRDENWTQLEDLNLGLSDFFYG